MVGRVSDGGLRRSHPAGPMLTIAGLRPRRRGQRGRRGITPNQAGEILGVSPAWPATARTSSSGAHQAAQGCGRDDPSRRRDVMAGHPDHEQARRGLRAVTGSASVSSSRSRSTQPHPHELLPRPLRSPGCGTTPRSSPTPTAASRRSTTGRPPRVEGRHAVRRQPAEGRGGPRVRPRPPPPRPRPADPWPRCQVHRIHPSRIIEKRDAVRRSLLVSAEIARSSRCRIGSASCTAAEQSPRSTADGR